MCGNLWLGDGDRGEGFVDGMGFVIGCEFCVWERSGGRAGSNFVLVENYISVRPLCGFE